MSLTPDLTESPETIEVVTSGYRKREEIMNALKANNPALAEILDKEKPRTSSKDPANILLDAGLPQPATGFRDQLKEAAQNRIDPTLIKDGHIYLLRGDFPELSEKGIYPHPFAKYGMTLDQMLTAQAKLPLNSHFNFRPNNKLEEMMWQHSNGGFEPFLSATPDPEIAGRHPKYGEIQGSIYVIKVPVERVIRNYASVVSNGHPEQEYLISDYVLPSQIVAELNPREQSHVDPRTFMHL